MSTKTPKPHFCANILTQFQEFLYLSDLKQITKINATGSCGE
jgi:hypothetical protein